MAPACHHCGEFATEVAAASRAVCFCGDPVLCPACEGDGCRHCGREGWTDEEDAERILAFLDSQRDASRYDDERAEFEFNDAPVTKVEASPSIAELAAEAWHRLGLDVETQRQSEEG